MTSKVDWAKMVDNGFVQLEEGKPKTLVLSDWKQQDKFKDDDGEIRVGVEFKVIEEDGHAVDKSYTLTAKGALKLFKPICEKAEAANKPSIKVSIVCVGKGKDRKYSVNEL